MPEVGRFTLPLTDAAIGADLQVDGVQIDDRPDGVQRAVLPGPDLVEHRVSDLGDQRRRNLDVVDFLKVALHLPGGHAPSVERQDLLVEAVQPDLALADELGLEVAVPVAWNEDLQIAIGVDDPLAGLAVAAVAGAAAARRVLLVAEVVSHLGLKGALDKALLELLEQARVLEQLLGGGVLG